MSTQLELNINEIRSELSRIQRSVSIMHSWLQMIEQERAATATADLSNFERSRNPQAATLLAALKAESSATSTSSLVYRINTILGITGMG